MKQTLTVTLLLFFSTSLFAQQHISQQEAEKRIVQYFKEMKHWRKKKGEHSIDSLYAVNRRLIQLMSDIGYEGYTLNADFKELRAAGMQIHTSDDKMVRTFCWEVVSYGTSHYYNYMITYYQSATRCLSFVNKDGTSMTDITTIQKFDGDNVYLLHEENKYDFHKRVSRYMAHTLKNGYLTLTTFFYNNNDSQSYAGYTYSLPTFSSKEPTPPQVKLSADKNTLMIPVISQGGKYEGEDLIYKFDGRRFVYDPTIEKKK